MSHPAVSPPRSGREGWGFGGRAVKSVLLWLALTAPAAALPKVVSINLCTDILLARLADPDQILGVTRFGRDRAKALTPEEAARVPAISGTAEEILMLRPDLVLAGRYTKRATRELIRRYGVRMAELDAARSIDQSRAQIREVGALLGQPDRADAMVARIDAALARTRRAAGAHPIRVLPLQRRGWVSGRATLLTSLLANAGLDNAGAAFSQGIGQQVTLEAIVALRPDLLLVSEGGGRAEDQGSALLQHPALERMYPPEKRIVLPDNLNVLCGGPTLVEAIERLAAAVERVAK